MKPKHLCRIGAVIVLSFLVLLLADTEPTPPTPRRCQFLKSMRALW